MNPIRQNDIKEFVEIRTCIAQQVRQRRNEKQLTIKELSKLSCVGTKSILAIERSDATLEGFYNPNSVCLPELRIILDLAMALECSLFDLINCETLFKQLKPLCPQDKE